MEVADGHRTLARVAWHIVQTIPEMLGRVGLSPEGPGEDDAVPTAAGEIADAYRAAAGSTIAQIRDGWTDETLDVEDEMYGDKWRRGFSLTAFLRHEIHHRGQMTVLMRQAGLRVPAIYGPAKEDWLSYGMSTPEI